MASSSEPKCVSKQRRVSKIVDEKFLLYPVHCSSKHEGKLKVKEWIGPTNKDLPLRKREDTDNGISAQSKTLRDTKDDELVKYMSKLPGYLQHEGRRDNFQGKALSVGVLDWARLEKWKHSQKGLQTTSCNNASSNGINISEKKNKKLTSTSRVVPKENQGNQMERHPSSSNLDSFIKDGISRGFQHSVQKFRRSRESELASRGSLNEHVQIRKTRHQTWTVYNHKFSGRNHTRVDPRKSRTRSNQKDSSSDMGNSLVMEEKPSALDGETQKRVAGIKEMCANQKASDEIISSDVGASSAKFRKYSNWLDLTEKESVRNDEIRKRIEGFQDSEIGLAYRKQAGQYRNIVLLRPRKHTQNILPEEPQNSLVDNPTETKQNSFSDASANQNVCSSKLTSQVPRSCPLSFDFDKDSHTSACPEKRQNEPLGRKCSEARTTSDSENTKKVDQERSKEESRKSRHPSPNRRFSFSFSRIGRSFSFKEGTPSQPLSSDCSVKSCSMRPDGSAYCLIGSKPEKSNGNNRTRSSPLRRLLDPLLKLKGTETALPSKVRPNSSTVELFQNEKKDDTSTIRALVQFTIRNGLPLFQFVVDDNSNRILAATLKNSSSSEKDGSVQHCTFYSVNEVKKKKSGSWISHGNKEKHCGFVYNILGQMRLSNSLYLDLNQQNFDNNCVVKESVLFEVELKQSDEAPEKIKPCRELAALVIKNDKNVMTNGLEENRDEFSTTIILPDGVHSLPNKGVPSPLIDRWRSSGLCDCGGWDIGCKLRVLSNQRHFQVFSDSSKAQLRSHSFQLFDQEGAEQNIPVFTMAPLKSGIYTIEFISSISLLQAFFICITVITCEKSPDDSGFIPPSERKAYEDQLVKVNDGTKKGASIIVREMPMKYAPFNPPLSPVGRA